MLYNWASLDGRRVWNGTPSLLTLSARQGLNLAYYLVTRYMKEEDRPEFERSISLTATQMHLDAILRNKQEFDRRQQTIRELAEVG